MPPKTKNPDRKGADGKAWKKSHGAPAKVLSPEALARKAEKDVRRGKRQPQDKPGSNITMPRITWDWAAEAMSGTRLTHTHRYRMVDACLVRGGLNSDDLTVEPNPEAKSSSRKNGR